jgi:hypothetical protein
MEDLEGGAKESLGPHGRPQRFYVVGVARTQRVLLTDSPASNSQGAPDPMTHIPLPRQAVERLFTDCLLDVVDILKASPAMRPHAHEDAAAYDTRLLEVEWPRVWRAAAVGGEDGGGAFREFHGMDRSNARNNGYGVFRWDVRRQRLEEQQEVRLDPVDAISRVAAATRLRGLWDSMRELDPTLARILFPALFEQPSVGEQLPEDGYATLPDVAFEPALRQGFTLTTNVDGSVTLYPHVEQIDSPHSSSSDVERIDAPPRSSDAVIPECMTEEDRQSVMAPVIEAQQYQVELERKQSAADRERLMEPVYEAQRYLNKLNNAGSELADGSKGGEIDNGSTDAGSVQQEPVDAPEFLEDISQLNAACFTFAGAERLHLDAALELTEDQDAWKQHVYDTLDTTRAVAERRLKLGLGPPLSFEGAQASLLPTESEVFTLGAGFDKYALREDDEGQPQYFTITDGAARDVRTLSGAALSRMRQLAHAYHDLQHPDPGGFADEPTRFVQSVLLHVGHHGVQPRTLMGRALQGLFATHGMVALPLRAALALHGSEGEDPRRAALERWRVNLQACFSGFAVPPATLQAMMDPQSSAYSTDGEEASSTHASGHEALYVLLAQQEDHTTLEAAAWCQGWARTREHMVLRVQPNVDTYTDERVENLPYVGVARNKRGAAALKRELSAAVGDALYLRAAGARSGRHRVLLYALELYALAELAHRPFSGVIARVPRVHAVPLGAEDAPLPFVPHVGVAAEQAQLLGLQRAFGVSGGVYHDRPDAEDANAALARDMVRARMIADGAHDGVSTSDDALLPYKFHRDGPWVVRLVEQGSTPAAAAAAMRAGVNAGLLVTNAASERALAERWAALQAAPEQAARFLAAHFTARVYPSPQHLFGSWVVLQALLQGGATGLLAGGAHLHGGALEDGQREYRPWDDSDGRLTALERAGRTIPDALLWSGEMPELRAAVAQE